jgi:hypothetical protein
MRWGSPENIVDQQQHVAVLVVPEILGQRGRVRLPLTQATIRAGLSNTAPQNPSECITGLEQRELDALRAATDRQDAWVCWFHGWRLCHSSIHLHFNSARQAASGYFTFASFFTDLWLLLECQTRLRPWITWISTTMMAMTSRAWMTPPIV